MQANVPREDASLATAYAMFSQLLGGAFFSAIAKTIFTGSIPGAIERFAPGIDPSLLINTGVTELAGVIPPDQLKGAILAYNQALSHVFVSALSALTYWRLILTINRFLVSPVGSVVLRIL